MSAPGLETELSNLRKRVERLHTDVLLSRSESQTAVRAMDQNTTALALLQKDLKMLIGNGQPGLISKIQQELKDHARLIHIAVGGVLVLLPILGYVANKVINP